MVFFFFGSIRIFFFLPHFDNSKLPEIWESEKFVLNAYLIIIDSTKLNSTLYTYSTQAQTFIYIWPKHTRVSMLTRMRYMCGFIYAHYFRLNWILFVFIFISKQKTTILKIDRYIHFNRVAMYCDAVKPMTYAHMITQNIYTYQFWDH